MPFNVIRCFDTTQNWQSAVLLCSIAFWQKRNGNDPARGVQRGDKKWIARSILDWCAACRLTKKQYKVALVQLKAGTLIETEQHLFAGKAITFIRLTEAGENVAFDLKMDHPGDPLQGPPRKSLQGPPIVQEQTTITNVIQLAVASAPANGTHASEPKDSGKETEAMKVHDIEAILDKGKTVKPVPVKKPGSLGELVEVWRDIGFVQKGLKPKPGVLTTVEMAQLKKVAKLIGTLALPVLKDVLTDWQMFRNEVEQKHGVKKTPEYPHVGFLLAHVTVAINFKSVAALPPEAKKTTQPDNIPSQTVLQSATAQPATKAEVLAILLGKGT